MRTYMRKINNLRKNNIRGLLAVVPKSVKKIPGSIYKMKLLRRISRCSNVTQKACNKKRSCKYVKKTKNQKGHCRTKRNKSHKIVRYMKR